MLSRKVSPSLLVIRHGTDDATTEDWNELIEYLASNKARLPRIRILVYTDGGSPTALQRKQLATALGDAEVTVASVSDSMKVRFVSSTISLFVRGFRQFTVRELEQAYNHLKLDLSERRLAAAALQDLEKSLYPETNKVGPEDKKRAP